jgi:RND superfamily putative drug exporter
VPHPLVVGAPGPRGATDDPWRITRLFAALGRFTVRFRWLIIGGWIVVTVLLMICLPSLASVEKSSNSQFLPTTAASVQANKLAQPFNPSNT